MKSSVHTALLLLLVTANAEDVSRQHPHCASGQSLLQSQQVQTVGKVSETELSTVLQQLAEKLPAGDTKDLFQSFSICGQCEQWKRFGETHDGGYLSCMDNLESQTLLAAYSMGVEEHDKWSLDIFKKFRIPIYQYDCTVSKPAQSCDQCHFFQACLGAKGSNAFPNKTMWTLKDAIRQSNMLDVPDRSLLLKMDIEGGEWPTLLDADVATLKKFRELIIEFHFLKQTKEHAKYLAVMRHLFKAGFHVTHLHGNNCCGTYHEDDLKLPNLVEVTLDADAPVLATCQNPSKLPMDRRNLEDKADLGVPRTEP